MDSSKDRAAYIFRALARISEQAAYGQAVVLAMTASPALQNALKNQRLLSQAMTASPATYEAMRSGRATGRPRGPRLRATTRRPAAWGEVGFHFRRRVHGVLLAIDGRLVVRLDGAWERVAIGGPDAASQAAHSTVELIDACLRMTAPDDEVLAWHAQRCRSAVELHEGRPTRGLQMRYVLRHRDPDGDLASELIRHGVKVLELLQGVKHGSRAPDLRDVAALIMSIEDLFAFLYDRDA